MPKKETRSVIPYYATGLCGLLYALVCTDTYVNGFLVLSIFSGAGFYLLEYFLSQGNLKRKLRQAVYAAKIKPLKAGDDELGRIREEGWRTLTLLRLYNDAIPDEKFSQQISELENATKSIFEFLSEKPDKIPQVHNFLNYSLPETLKLLSSYSELQRQPLSGDNINKAMQRIEGSFDFIVASFKKQLDDLFFDKTMNIEADINVMEALLKNDNDYLIKFDSERS